MKFKYLSMLPAILFTCGMSLAQTHQIDSVAVEDFKPASTNQPGKQYPQVNSEGRVRASISAPEAHKVQLDISAVKYDLVKDEKGVWTGDSKPQDEGFHTISFGLTGLQFLIPTACTSMALVVGEVVLKSLLRIKISTPSRTCPMAKYANIPIFPKAITACVVVSCTHRPNMIRTPRNAIPCCTCNTVAAKMRQAGPIRARRIS